MLPRNLRDQRHLSWTRECMVDHHCRSLLDLGSFDDWLGYCLECPDYQGVELERDGDWLSYDTKGRLWDAVAMYEVLEHLPLERVMEFVQKAINCTNSLVMVSLPDQETNPQGLHLWRPTESLIAQLFPSSADVIKIDYPGTDVPPNWLIHWELPWTGTR